MQPVLSAAQMREADRRTIAGGVPGVVLMERAGAAVAQEVRRELPAGASPVVLCGKGHNGGDGLVAARHLLDRGAAVVLLGARGEVGGDVRHHLEALEQAGGRVLEVGDEQAWDAARARALAGGLVVDALLGTGLRDRPRGLTARVIGDVVQWRRAGGGAVVAVDIPSGLSSDDGAVEWAVEATLTVTFAAPKYGHVLPPACDHVGRLVIADIGIGPEAVAATAPSLWLLEPQDARAAWSPRAPGAHKGTYGHVLLVAGSVGKTGAAVLASTAALRSGAGLATVATPASALPLVVAAGRPEVMTEPLPEQKGELADGSLAPALALAARREATVLGPGLGQGPALRAFVRGFVTQRSARALVIDADGLNALAPGPGEGPEVLEAVRYAGATVLTPHPGEMGRLLGWPTAEVQARRLEAARRLAAATGAVVILKGQRTLVARPDGQAAVNPTGNAGMATGGTGDVLAGMVGALLARGVDPWHAACAAAYAHGRAGDVAAGRLGQEAMLAGDLIEALPEALR